jgi:hypothetical protein
MSQLRIISVHHSLKLTKDIAGRDYEEFLLRASERFPSFMLVWRDQLTFSRNAQSYREMLEPLKVRQRHTHRWPGNEMIGHKGLVITYRLEPAVLNLQKRPGSLFKWLAPRYPEDLAFFTGHGECAVVSVTHEKDVWILDLEFGRSLPKRFGLIEEAIDDSDWAKFFDYRSY